MSIIIEAIKVLSNIKKTCLILSNILHCSINVLHYQSLARFFECPPWRYLSLATYWKIMFGTIKVITDINKLFSVTIWYYHNLARWYQLRVCHYQNHTNHYLFIYKNSRKEEAIDLLQYLNVARHYQNLVD